MTITGHTECKKRDRVILLVKIKRCWYNRGILFYILQWFFFLQPTTKSFI